MNREEKITRFQDVCQTFMNQTFDQFADTAEIGNWTAARGGGTFLDLRIGHIGHTAMRQEVGTLS